MNHKKCRKTVLCTWELGGQLGHISSLSHITGVLEGRNYRCYAALKDLSRASSFFEGQRTSLLQAPVFLPKIKMQRPVQCLADTLLLAGYLKVEELQGLLQAWRNLIELINPDILISDYSPTAVLAARELSCSKIFVGSGFAQPVQGHPIRSWNPDHPQPEMIKRQEAMVVNTINKVLQLQTEGSQKEAPVTRISDLYEDSSRVIITSTPEFDLYNDLRSHAIYQVKTNAGKTRPSVRFGCNDRPKLLAYLNPGHPQFDIIAEALAQCKATVFVICPRTNPNRLKHLESEHFQFSTEPVQFTQALAEADLLVNHGNNGATMESVLMGTPVFALPIHLEQLLTAKTLEQLGIGHCFIKPASVTQLKQALNKALESEVLTRKCALYAKNHGELVEMSLGDRVANECDALLN
ncbi:MAG: hypothetical protein VXY23_17925 [Pseudomonadota bacterium]|nr:hypothetical protein [Pseudomonadota bacterium]|tara:strand:- start:35499 stop:36725 length:1227 start_codon:yes stop_codon:yes gene_type:complete